MSTGSMPEIRPCRSGAATPPMSPKSVSRKRCGLDGHEETQMDDPGSTRFSEQHGSGSQPKKPREFYLPDFQANARRLDDTWKDAYDKLFKRYQQQKTRHFAEVQGLFDSQSQAIETHTKDEEDLQQELRSALSEDHGGPIARARELEAALLESQNAVALGLAKNLELQQELESSRVYESNMLRESSLMRELLQSAIHLTISSVGKSAVHFCHERSGFKFKLEKNRLSESVGGEDALLYTAVSPEKLSNSAPDWMYSQIVFDSSQYRLFISRILGGATGSRRR